MAQLPKEPHETILAEVMRRKRLAENVAISAVWRSVSAPRKLGCFPFALDKHTTRRDLRKRS